MTDQEALEIVLDAAAELWAQNVQQRHNIAQAIRHLEDKRKRIDPRLEGGDFE